MHGTRTGKAAAAEVTAAIRTLRKLSIALFGAMEDHPWLAAYLMRDISIQANSLRIYERFGQQVLRLSHRAIAERYRADWRACLDLTRT